MSARTDDLQTGNAPDAGGWRFDDSVTDAFDDMLSRSIPMYEVMRKTVTDAAIWTATRHRNNAQPGIVDLGASRGSALAPIIDQLGSEARYEAYEISRPMIEVMRQRFATEIDRGLVSVREHDLRNGLPRLVRNGHCPPRVILSVLTIQFVPIEYRQRILRDIWKALDWGGGFVWVEKVLGATADLDEMEVDLYYGLKRGNGYTQEAIDRKRLSLEGVLVPLPARFNEELLRSAGFVDFDVIWSWMNFRCWAALKG